MTYCGDSGGAGGLYGLTEEDSSQHSWEAEPAGGWKLAHMQEKVQGLLEGKGPEISKAALKVVVGIPVGTK